MAHAFDVSFFFSDESEEQFADDSRPADYQYTLIETMPPHYAWLSLNPNASADTKKAIESQIRAQKHQQQLINNYGLDEQELQMMRDLKKTLQAETHMLMQRVGHWLKQFDPSLNVDDHME